MDSSSIHSVWKIPSFVPALVGMGAEVVAQALDEVGGKHRCAVRVHVIERGARGWCGHPEIEGGVERLTHLRHRGC